MKKAQTYIDNYKKNSFLPCTDFEGKIIVGEEELAEMLQEFSEQQLRLYIVGNCAKLQSEVDRRRKQITDINQWTEILLAYRHKIRDRVLWSMIADINNRTTD